MSSLGETGSIERRRFFDGQRLVADDLQGVEGFHREMRWLHNASLHQPGIGSGFAVAGAKGDREVTVEPGYAVDDLGREIVLTRRRVLPVPPVAGDGPGRAARFALTVRYPSDEDLEVVELRRGVCETAGAVRLREDPIFYWVAENPDGTPREDQADIVRGRVLVLAEIAVRDCRLDAERSVVQRRNARPPTQPTIACGVASPTAWQDWNPWDVTEERREEPGGAELVEGPVREAFAVRTIYRLVGGVEAWIDTTAGGFRTVPDYLGRLDGERVLPWVADGETFTAVLDGQLSVVDPTPDGFVARVLVLALDVRGAPPPRVRTARSAPAPSPLVTLLTEHWRVGWMGVEGS